MRLLAQMPEWMARSSPTDPNGDNTALDDILREDGEGDEDEDEDGDGDDEDEDEEDDFDLTKFNFDLHENFQYEVLVAPRFERARRKPLPDAVVESVERQNATNTSTDLTPFGHRVYDTFDAFLRAWSAYQKKHYVRYRVRTSQTIADFNKKSETLQLPVELKYIKRTWRCTHGVFQAPRGNGKRTPRTTRFTDCGARLTAWLVRVGNKWAVHSVNEVIRHNHKCSKRVFDSYRSAAVLLEEHDLFNEVVAMIQAQAPTATTLDAIALLTSVVLTAQQLANFKRDRLGGRTALANLRLLLQRFSAFDGSRCLVIQDQGKQVCGIVVQSAAQRAMLEKYGDNLILDWTHNTNNVGYYLGSLMVTSVSGSGVSVCDFVCMTQSKEMMKAVFSFFIETNPAVMTTLASIVIDKDYTEWSVLLELFPGVAVLLCQFHVVKWFAQVVTDDKYAIPVVLRDRVYAILHDMVYVRSCEDFQSRRWLLENLLRQISPDFLTYLEDRWYTCRPMWSDCERGAFFTAINSTSNRIEASWSQVKGILGMKLRVDMCFQALFTYGTAVLRREIKWIAEYDGPTSVLRADADPFIRPVLAEVSDYCAEYIKDQHESHFRMQLTHVAIALDETQTQFSVEKLVTNGPPRVVDTRVWTCTCASYVTSRLPCRHIIFVSRVHLHHQRLPLAVVPPRWMLACAVSSLPMMERWAGEMQTLRVSLLTPSAAVVEATLASAEEDQEDYDFSNLGPNSSYPSVAHVVLRRREVASSVVVDNIEKRNVAEAAFEPLRAFLMVQSSRRFQAMAAQMQDVFTTLLASWQACELPDDADDSAKVEVAEDDADCRIASMVAEAVPHVVLHARTATPPAKPNTFEAGGLQSSLPVTRATTCGQVDEQLLLRSPLYGIPAPPEIVGRVGSEAREESDCRSVSSLGVSNASSIIQATAIQDAIISVSGTVHLDTASEHLTANRRAAPGSDAAAKRSAAAAQLDDGILSSMTLAVKPSSNTTKKQKARAAASARVATVGQKTHCPVLLEDFVCAVRKTPGVSYATETLQAYPLLFDDEWLLKRDIVTVASSVVPADLHVNFTIPKAFLHKLQTSNQKAQGVTEDMTSETDQNVSTQLVSKVAGAYAVRGFIPRNLAAFIDYYDAEEKGLAYERDVAWLTRRSASSEISFYPYPAFSKTGVQMSSASVNAAVVEELASCSLESSFEVDFDETTTSSIKLSEVVGHLAGDARLNDSVLVFAMRQIASARDDILVLDSLRPALCKGQIPFPIPESLIETYGAIIFPVNLTQSHWGLIVAAYNLSPPLVILYDPLMDPANHHRLRCHWTDFCEPFITAWMRRDNTTTTTITPREYILKAPRQAESDGTNCGIYCIAACTDIVANSDGFESLVTLSEEVVAELRLRVLWGVICKARKAVVEGVVEASSTIQKFAAFNRALERGTAAKGGAKAKAKAARRPGK